MIAYLQTLGGTPTVTLQTSHHYYTAPGAAPGAAPAPAAAPAPGSRARRGAGSRGSSGPGQRARRGAASGRPRRRASSETMNIPVVLAVAAVFGLLRFRRANLLMWALAWWVGIYVLLRFGFTAPIPSSVISIYMGISLDCDPGVRVLQPGAPRRSLRPARPVHDGEAVHSVPRRNGRRHPGARGRERLRPDERPLQPPLFSRTVHPASPTEITVHDKRIDLDAGENPFLHLETSNPEEFRKHVENGRQVYYRNCVFCHGDNLAGNGMFVHGLDPIPTNFADENDPAVARHVSLLADFQGRPRASRGRRALGHGHAGLGEVPEGRGDLGRRSSFSTISPARGLAPGRRPPRNDLPSDRSARRLAVLSRCPDRLVVCRADGIGARAGSRRRDRGAAGVGQDPLPQVLFAVPRREGGRRRLRHPAPVPQAPRLHDGQVQGSDDSQRSAPDPSGPRQHHQARHALHLDARLARPLRPGSVGSRLLHHDLLPRLLERRECPPARGASERAGRHEQSRSSSGRSSTRRPAA